jgi:6-phosphogluconolactonase/glucosamine-6-phosphate isomerase/deaminase
VENIRFIKIAGPERFIEDISESLTGYLSKGSVLLLLSGGSAISAELRILSNLKGKMTVTLNDERYGPIGHKDSNWQQLIDGGLEDMGMDLMPILSGEGIEATTERFNSFLNKAKASFDHIISILGMGPDGHTTGILPGSQAVTADSYACSYQGPDYARITNTFNFLRLCDETFVLALGEAKHQQIDKLNHELDLSEQPIQIIKGLNKVTFYNDYKGEE